MRREFSKTVKRQALERSGYLCEATGEMYGFNPGQRCNAPLSLGVQFDHVIADSIGGEPTLENCAAVCVSCHGFKTRNTDTPRAAKTKRQSDKDKGIVRPKGTIKSAGFPQIEKPSKSLSKPLPPRRSLFAPAQAQEQS